MKITFLIGNGFDLNFGIKTKYSHFYEYYLKQDILVDIKNEDEKLKVIKCIKEFKEALNNNLENWSDLEIALGNYASKFSKDSEKEFIALLNDIQDNLADYIDKQDKDFSISETDKKKLLNDLVAFEGYLTPREKEIFLSHKNQFLATHYEVNVITFNYSKTFEKIYEWQNKPMSIGNRTYSNSTFYLTLKSVEHIHGTTESNMILGVNDLSQIENEELRTSIQILRALIKTEINKNAGTLRDNRSVNCINSSDIICLYGMSIGATDRYWWEKIVEKLKHSNCRLIIFSKKGEILPRRYYMAQNLKDEIIDLLLSYSKLSDNEITKIKSQIFVCLNSKMFGAELIYKENDYQTKAQKIVDAVVGEVKEAN